MNSSAGLNQLIGVINNQDSAARGSSGGGSQGANTTSNLAASNAFYENSNGVTAS